MPAAVYLQRQGHVDDGQQCGAALTFWYGWHHQQQVPQPYTVLWSTTTSWCTTGILTPPYTGYDVPY
jgi:hypothetical protein